MFSYLNHTSAKTAIVKIECLVVKIKCLVVKIECLVVKIDTTSEKTAIVMYAKFGVHYL